jgi:chorismate mutase
MVQVNNIKTEDIAAVSFSSTVDLDATFPAIAARKLGWIQVPLFGMQEIDCPTGLPLCIRVLILLNTDVPQNAIKHVYLREAVVLRNDINE